MHDHESSSFQNVARNKRICREYSDAYSKISGILRQYHRDEPALDNNCDIIGFPDDNNNSASFKFKQQITGQTGNSSRKDVEIMVPLTYLSNLWRTLEMALINCKISLQLKWSRNCIIVAETAIDQSPGFQTLSTHENIKLVKQLSRHYTIYLVEFN